MKITIIGTGYVGLVTGACMAEVGNDVLCLDLDERKIDLLKSGEVPIHEAGLFEMVQRNIIKGRLRFTTSIKESVDFGVLQFIAVGTPPDEDGSADLKYVLAAAESIGRYMTEYKVVVDKSTVPVGTADKVRDAIKNQLSLRSLSVDFDVVSNPEFLKEGVAINDFMKPDRVIIGSDNEHASNIMRELYSAFIQEPEKFMVLDIKSAELTKYAANCMLATRISFMNEIANLAEKIGADIEQVRRGIGSDPRIGPYFLNPGCGYGGSCFPKDVQALISTGENSGVSLHVLAAVEVANERQKRIILEKIMTRFPDNVEGRHFALWGLAFKPNTDDMRSATSRVIIEGLLELGATVCAYDQVAMPESARIFGDDPRISYAESPMGAVCDADALIIVTEWDEFKSPDLKVLKTLLKNSLVFDGRNIYKPAQMLNAGFEYYSIGR